MRLFDQPQKCAGCGKMAEIGTMLPNILGAGGDYVKFCMGCGSDMDAIISMLEKVAENPKVSADCTIGGSLKIGFVGNDGEALSMMPDFQYQKSIEWHKTKSNSQVAMYPIGPDHVQWALFFGEDDGNGMHSVINFRWEDMPRHVRKFFLYKKPTIQMFAYCWMFAVVKRMLNVDMATAQMEWMPRE